MTQTYLYNYRVVVKYPNAQDQVFPWSRHAQALRLALAMVGLTNGTIFLEGDDGSMEEVKV